MLRRAFLAPLIVSLSLLAGTVAAQHDHGQSLLERAPDSDRSTAHQEGLHVNPVPTFAILGATVHATPTSEPKVQTVVIRDGKIIAMGVDIDLPTGAKIVDLTGKHLYAGLIDAYTETELAFDPSRGTGYWNENIRPQQKVSSQFDPGTLNFGSLRKIGFTAALIAPNEGILKGQSSVLMLGDETNEHCLLTSDVAQHLRLTVSRGRGRGYPNSPMGAYALARQTMLDAQWYQQAQEAVAANPQTPRPETNEALVSLQPAISGKQLVMIDSSNELFALRADRFAREFGLKAIVLGSGNEYRRIREIKQTGRTIVLPLDFPDAPDVSSPELAQNVSLETMMHWDHAPENPGRLAEHGINFVLTSHGLEKRSDFLKQVRTAIKRGLDPAVALDAMTLGVAKLYQIDHLVGTIETNKLANLTIADGDLFAEGTKVNGVCIDGKMFLDDHANLRQIAGKWKLDGKFLDGQILELKDSNGKVSGTIAAASADAKPDKSKEAQAKDEQQPEPVKVNSMTLAGTRLTGTFDSKSLDKVGVSMFSIVFADEELGIGRMTWPDGSVTGFKVTPADEWDKVVNGHQHQKPAPDKSNEAKDAADDNEAAEDNTEQIARTSSEDQDSDPQAATETESSVAVDRSASFPVNYPLGAFGRDTAPAQPGSVLIKNVTVWTLDERGKIENGAVLFGGGKIKQVFDAQAKLPKADLVIDGQGGHVTPGIIDCHSHMATDSGVNESGQAITAEVRIGDMIDCNDITIYRQLAGGTTMANVLHGSANPIGGQNQVIKLRWGANEEQMKFQGAPLGIKFALGENVKQSNWSNPSNRYPQTRMGVEQLIDDAFRAAEDYLRRWEDWEQNKTGLPPRRDLELEALAEIVKGERWVHCHSYRQDEILALIRTLDAHGITIGSFQHILEGYKVADAMAKHGATGSAFADWWAYKYEVKDAIPYAGALMHNAGVVVSFNSDDGELGRRMNQEAVKAVRYGGVPEVEALKFVTLNPAKQLRIDDRVGSIEVGKDADLVLWTRSPLSNLATVKQTWIDGRKYFDRSEDASVQEKQQRMRVSLIQKILGSGDKMVKPDKSKVDPAKLWPRYDEFCGHHDHEHGDQHLHGQGGDQ